MSHNKTDHYFFWTRATFEWVIDFDLLIYWFIDLSLHTDILPSINQLSKTRIPRKIVYFININKTTVPTFFLSFSLFFFSPTSTNFDNFPNTHAFSLPPSTDFETKGRKITWCSLDYVQDAVAFFFIYFI